MKFKDIQVGEKFKLLGLTYVKKSKRTAGLANNPKCWDYFSENDEIVKCERE